MDGREHGIVFSPTWEGGGDTKQNTAPPSPRTTLVVTDLAGDIVENVGTIALQHGFIAEDAGHGVASVQRPLIVTNGTLDIVNVTELSISSGLVLTAPTSSSGVAVLSANGGGFSPMETFITSSQMLTPPVGATLVEFTVAAAGGAGANGGTVGSGGAGGGGGGQFVRNTFKISDLPAAPWAVTIGAGGAAPGGDGSYTAVGSFLIANYGYGATGTAGGLGGLFGESYVAFFGSGGKGGDGSAASGGNPGVSGQWSGGGGGAGGDGGSSAGGGGGFGNVFAGQAPGGTAPGGDGGTSSITFLPGQGYGGGGGGGGGSTSGAAGNGSPGQQYGGGGGGGGSGVTPGNGADGAAGYARAIFS
jgi:hypothetical protein